MTESALAETHDASGFDAVLLTSTAAAMRVGGMQLVERAAFTLARAGARRLLCVGSRTGGGLRLPDVEISWATSEDAVSRWSAAADRPIIGLEARTITDERTITALAEAGNVGPLSDPQGRLWRCLPATLPAVIAAARQRTRRGGLPGTHVWTPPASALLLPVDDAADRADAETRLLGQLGRPGDSWLARMVDRRLSRALTRRLMHTRVRPNQITLLSIAIGISGGLLFAVGSYAATSAGALLFLLSTILDGCDGELARLTFRESRAGAHLDVIGDNVVHLVVFAGLGSGLYRVMPASHIAVLGAALLVGAVSAMASVYLCIVRGTPTPAQRRLYETFASREFAYLLAALTLAGRLDLFLWIAAIGIHVFATTLWLLGRRRARPGR